MEVCPWKETPGSAGQRAVRITLLLRALGPKPSFSTSDEKECLRSSQLTKSRTSQEYGKFHLDWIHWRKKRKLKWALTRIQQEPGAGVRDWRESWFLGISSIASSIPVRKFCLEHFCHISLWGFVDSKKPLYHYSFIPSFCPSLKGYSPGLAFSQGTSCLLEDDNFYLLTEDPRVIIKTIIRFQAMEKRTIITGPPGRLNLK